MRQSPADHARSDHPQHSPAAPHTQVSTLGRRLCSTVGPPNEPQGKNGITWDTLGVNVDRAVRTVPHSQFGKHSQLENVKVNGELKDRFLLSFQAELYIYIYLMYF
jgi:hypothetical protein